jgi:hypothetical protein
MQPVLAAAGILGVSIVLAVTVYVVGRIRIEHERTLQTNARSRRHSTEATRPTTWFVRHSLSIDRRVICVVACCS